MAATTATLPVKVYILLGQSNMLGMGTIGNEDSGDGSLYFACHSKGLYPYLLNDDDGSQWKIREDVRYVFNLGNALGEGTIVHNEWMTVVGKTIGPELGIGNEVRVKTACTNNAMLDYLSHEIPRYATPTGRKQQLRTSSAREGLHWKSLAGLGSAPSWFRIV
jgi:hypothetical protein